MKNANVKTKMLFNTALVLFALSRCIDTWKHKLGLRLSRIGDYLVYKNQIGELYLFPVGMEGYIADGTIYYQERRDQGIIRERLAFSIANRSLARKGLGPAAIREIHTHARMMGYNLIWVEKDGYVLSQYSEQMVPLSQDDVQRTMPVNFVVE